MHNIEILKDRGHILKQARLFFEKRGLLEVDCPILSASAAVDAHIDLIPAIYRRTSTVYLHSSPEYGMKRLLAEGIGDIYQLSHVFRDGEQGLKHNPEFMMAEWYRVGMDLEGLIHETVDFICVFLGQLPFIILRYREAFQKYAGIDYITSTEQDLLDYLKDKGIPYYEEAQAEGKDALLNLILGSVIEPQLGQNGLCVLTDYPASQAALAKKKWVDSEQVAERFEVYYQGLELANGYHELTNSEEQRQRFIEANKMRLEMGKEALPIDENFLAALNKGLPDCSGVAVGFDRLMMLRHKKTDIADVISWDWTKA